MLITWKINKIENWKNHKNAFMLWNSDGVFKDNSDDVDYVDDVDDNDNIVDIEDIVNTLGKLNFSVIYSLSLILSTRSTTWCFVDDVLLMMLTNMKVEAWVLRSVPF